ncbi:putative glycerophosphodiester phosphodiesterase, protein kinase RLK-Pelle-LRK10L-2 family [Helianthus annuus]|nr:putative glycerophosphodiester phosphodiesterase, protein kinase RLK-Pelle-LRK10L-2 family [Helianthus annuus]
MIILFLFFMFVILSCDSAKDHNVSNPICPESFNCTGLAQFKYPFYNVTDTRCGLIKVNCTTKGAVVELGGRSYEIINKFDSDSSFMIRDRTFEELIEAKSCEALNNFTSPTPLLFSISIAPFITLFKCSKKNLSYTQQMDAYFKQPTYNSYNLCKDHNFYYNYSVNNGTVPSDLPHSCQVIRLPAMLLSPSCIECQRIGGQCHARYGIFQCLDAKQDAGKKSSRVILVIALGVGSVTILITMVLCFRTKVRWRTKSKNNVNVEIFLKNHEFIAPKRYSYSQVQKMTNSFEVKLGQGGFGSVYKGAISDQNLVAVKVLNELKGDGEDFINEVASVGSTSHVNIVSLVGYCLEGRRKALIYEFMPNGSLERFIYGRGSSSNSDLGWEKLHQIAIGIARGLEYLHTGCNTRILHLDIKPHNILLDQDFCPKISDFGLAKLFPNERSMISMSRMRGTPGYIAPELFSRTFGQVSHKSDVYSYGMLILEMVGGRRNIEVEVDHTSEIYFPHWIYKKIVSQEEELGLHGIVNAEENETTRKMIIVGLWCIQTNPLSRPTISKVLEMLEDNIASLEIPPKPYIFSPSRSVASSSTGQLSH